MKNIINEIQDHLKGIEDGLTKILEIDKRAQDRKDAKRTAILTDIVNKANAKAKADYEKQFGTFLNKLIQPHATLD
jgi:hypothetical protein